MSQPDVPAEALTDAIRERDLAAAAYRDADPDLEAVCWHRLRAASERVRAILRQAREATACR